MKRTLLGPAIPLAILAVALVLSAVILFKPVLVGPVVGGAAFLGALIGIVGLVRSWNQPAPRRHTLAGDVLAAVGATRPGSGRRAA